MQEGRDGGVRLWRTLLESVRPDAPAYGKTGFHARRFRKLLQERRLTMRQKILVVDAARKPERSACAMLSKDYDVICASSGEEAVKLYEQERPDLILTDLDTPNMSGFELQRILQERHKEMIPMMFMSSDGNEENEIMAWKAARSTTSAAPSRPRRCYGAWATSYAIWTGYRRSNSPPTPTP